MSAKIVQVHARPILDSRGSPTVKADVVPEGGILGRAAVPSAILPLTPSDSTENKGNTPQPGPCNGTLEPRKIVEAPTGRALTSCSLGQVIGWSQPS